MKTQRTLKLIHALAVVGGFALFPGAAHAAPFLYSAGDLVLAFRQTGNASDYVVNIGKATNYNALPPGATVNITNLSQSQLSSAFPSLNGLKWSVGGANRPPVDPNYPLQTLWVIAPRLDPNLQSTPWLRKGQAVQGLTASQVDGVGYNAAQASSNLPGGPDNTAAGVVIPVNNNFTIGPLIGSAGNYGNFQGNVEAITAEDFDSEPANVSRADLFELLPGTTAAGTLNAPGRYLGYFEFKPDGSLSFKTGSTPPPPPAITKIERSGELTTVSFTTVSGATYQLQATDAAGLTLPPSTWVPGSSIVGNGSVQSLQDTSASAIRFFTIQVQP